MPDPKMPLQPIYLEDGQPRFRHNTIVRWLLDAGPFDLNQIGLLPGITDQERMQFNALLGYSVDGWGGPHCAEGAAEVEEADGIAEALMKKPEVKGCCAPGGHFTGCPNSPMQPPVDESECRECGWNPSPSKRLCKYCLAVKP